MLCFENSQQTSAVHLDFYFEERTLGQQFYSPPVAGFAGTPPLCGKPCGEGGMPKRPLGCMTGVMCFHVFPEQSSGKDVTSPCNSLCEGEGLPKFTTFEFHWGLCSMLLGYRLVINDGKEGAQASFGFADLMGL